MATLKATLPYKEFPSDIKETSIQDDKVLQSSTTSLYSEATIAPTSDFTSGKSLFIHARGIDIYCLSSEMEIPIVDADGNIIYTSTRASRCSGNCILVDPKVGNIIATKYFFGPSRDPLIKLLNGNNAIGGDEIKTTSKWTSRTHTFLLPNGRQFEWRYVKERGEDGKKATSLVLQEKSGYGKVIARLVRNDKTRAPGSTKCSTGNGGELVFDINAFSYLDEPFIVASCLLMLKKEIDRNGGTSSVVFV